MTDLTDFQVTDFVSQVLAAQYNRVIDAALRGELSNTETLAANRTLLATDFALQIFSPTAARDVNLPAIGSTNHPFYIINVSASFDLTVKNAGGTVIGTVPVSRAGIFVSNGINWYALLLALPDATASAKGAIQLAGQLGGTAASPDVRGLRETLGPTLLALGTIGDGQILKRVGSVLQGTAEGVALAGQIGGTIASPDVRGLRETSGPALLTYGAVADGQYLKRSGSSVIGANPFIGYIAENSAQLIYVGANAYSVLPGSADVNGTMLTWASNIARTSVSLSANTLYYVYLYSNAGTPAVEESTTVPVWDSTLLCYKKTGDSTRRCIGFIEANATPAIRSFVNIVSERISEILYTDGSTTGKIVVSAGTATTWTSFSLAPLVPAHATHVSMILKLSLTTIADEGLIGISPIDLSPGASNTAPNQVRGKAAYAGANIFFGSSWNAIQTAQTYYYILSAISGTPAVNIEVHGARFVR